MSAGLLGVCPVELTEDQKAVEKMSLKFIEEHKTLLDDADGLVNKEFHRITGFEFKDMAALSDVEFNHANHALKVRLNELSKQIVSGKMLGKMGRLLWSTKELADRNPIMSEVYDNFVNTTLSYKGRSLKTDNTFSTLLEHLGRASKEDAMYTDLTGKGHMLSKTNMQKAIKYSTELEERIQLLQQEAENRVPGAKEEYDLAVSERNEWLSKGEGKIFNDFVDIIELGLPRLSKEIDTWMKEKFELQERNKNRVWTRESREAHLKKIRKHVGTITLTRNINGKDTDVPITGSMQSSVTTYIDLMADAYRTLKLGVDAYVDGIVVGIESKFSPTEAKSRTDKLKLAKAELAKALLPDEVIGYYPHFRIDMNAKFLDELMPNADNLAIATRDNIQWSKKGIDKAIDDVTTFLTKRLSYRDPDVEPGLYSRNFPVVIKRYVSEVNRFNHIAHTQKFTREALKEVKRIYGKGKDLDGIAQEFVNMVEDMNFAQLGTKDINHPEWENARRILLNFEYMSKLGMNFRTAAKNSTQSLLNFVFFGPTVMKEAKDFYDNRGAGFENDVRIMMEEAGLAFKGGTPELQEAVGAAMRGKQIVKLTDGYEITFRKPSFGDRVSKKMTEVAGGRIMSGMMQGVENKNRQWTFKIAYAKMHQQLEANNNFRQWFAANKGESNRSVDQEIKSRARNYAIRMTNLLHFDYADVSKSKWMRHPLGRFAFQFQHYLLKFFELNKKVLFDDMKIAASKRDPFSDEMWTAYRMNMVYLGVPWVLSMLTDNLNWFNFIEHAGVEKAQQIFTMFTGDDDEIRRASYGRGGLGVVGFPIISDLMTVGEMTKLWDFKDNEWAAMMLGWQDYREQDKEFRYAKTLGLINTQLKRAATQTWPLISSAHPGTAVQFELGLYPSADVKKRNEYFYKMARNVSPDLAEYYEDVMNVYDQFVTKSKRQEQRYFRGY